MPLWWARAGLAVVASGLLGLLLVVFANHLASPEITRGSIYESVYRILAGQPIYPAPSAAFVPLDYHPLVFLVAAGAARVLGLTPATLRLVAILGTAGAGWIVFLAVRRAAGSAWFAWMALGLFAGAYRAFDCYFDYPHPDSWMLCSALVGLYLLEASRRRSVVLAAVALLCASFWFKQQGALLAIGGVLFVTWRRGVAWSAPAWILAALLGPGAYVVLGPRIFGDHFIYYTYAVPSAYAEVGLRTFLRPAHYVVTHWLLLAGVSGWVAIRALRRRESPDVWLFTSPFALLIGLLGSMDYAENNVYMAPAVWVIILGTSGLARIVRDAADGPELARAARRVALILLVSFAMNLYDPRTVLVPAGAWRDYDDLVERVRRLGGIVYLPGAGQLPSGVRLPIVVHWVPLEDLVRGRGQHPSSAPLVREVLRDLVAPPGPAWIIAERPLAEEPLFAFLEPHYALVEDLGERYRSLRAMPGWYSGKTWPRYVYRYQPPAAGGASS